MDKCIDNNKNNNIAIKSASRLAAVMIIYSYKFSEFVDDDIEDTIIKEINTNDDFNGMEINPNFSKKLISGVLQNLNQINDLISTNIAEKWEFEKENILLLSIIQVASFELLELTNTPTKVIINEYIEIAKAYFEGSESKFVNGILDSIAKKIRPQL